MKKIKKIMGMLTSLAMVAVMSIGVYGEGYGQGKNVDEKNRPTGALNFNSKYSNSNAYAINEKDERILLTFDQGYENGYTEKILDTLKEKNIKAIFFLTGDYAKQETALVKRMIDEGHILGNHGMTHASLAKLTPTETKQEISSLHEYVYKTYGVEMGYLRPPCGEYTAESLKATQNMGYTTLFWSFAYVDWLTDKQPAPDKALSDLTASLHPGAIYLLHSVSATNADILGEFIDLAVQQGYRF
jgi:peptidoglycan-N-acetylmuramic acid deacetylase